MYNCTPALSMLKLRTSDDEEPQESLSSANEANKNKKLAIVKIL